MKNKKANLVVNLICALLICVFGGVSVYAVAAINYTHTASSSIGFVATSVSGTVTVGIRGVSEDLTFDNSPAEPSTTWVFDAYSDRTHQTATKSCTLGSSGNEIEMTSNQVVITIEITNRSPDAYMNVAIIDITRISSEVGGDNFTIQIWQDGVYVPNEDEIDVGSLTCTPIIPNATSTILFKIIVPNGTSSITSTTSFKLNLTRGDEYTPPQPQT